MNALLGTFITGALLVASYLQLSVKAITELQSRYLESFAFPTSSRVYYKHRFTYVTQGGLTIMALEPSA